MEQIPHITFTECDPRKRIAAGIKYYMKDRAKWIPAYDKVAQWFGDNHSRGLICTGPCGLGKSLICCDILPKLYFKHFGEQYKVLTVSATEMAQRIHTLLQFCDNPEQNGKPIIVIDDLGAEEVEEWVKTTAGTYRKCRAFCELVDRAERTGTMLIITTNLFTTIPRLKVDCAYGKAGQLAPRLHESIEARYGIRTLDRLRAITSVVLFDGESMRA